MVNFYRNHRMQQWARYDRSYCRQHSTPFVYTRQHATRSGYAYARQHSTRFVYATTCFMYTTTHFVYATITSCTQPLASCTQPLASCTQPLASCTQDTTLLTSCTEDNNPLIPRLCIQPLSFKLVGDNIDKNVKARYLRSDHGNSSLHYFHSFAVKDRIDFSHLSSTLPLHAPTLRARWH